MNLNEIEELVKIVRDARVSELEVSIGDSTVRLRKPLATAGTKPKAQAKTASVKPSAAQAAPSATGPVELYIFAPMVGIFHSLDGSAEQDGAVRQGQSVGMIESMKLMNDVRSEYDGVIEEVLIEDDMPVEYGQRLFKIRTA